VIAEGTGESGIQKQNWYEVDEETQGVITPEIRWSIIERSNPGEDDVGGRSRVTRDEERVLQLMRLWRYRGLVIVRT